jgi:hypothetical protein
LVSAHWRIQQNVKALAVSHYVIAFVNRNKTSNKPSSA